MGRAAAGTPWRRQEGTPILQPTLHLKRAVYLVPIAALALTAMAMAACGDDDDGGNQPTAAATTAVSSPAASPTSAATRPAAASPTTAQSTGTTIRLEDNVFVPDNTTIAVGTEVTWQWAGQAPHSVEGTFNGQQVKSTQQVNGTFRFTFASAGTFAYQCGVHGAAMSGRIVVQ